MSRLRRLFHSHPWPWVTTMEGTAPYRGPESLGFHANDVEIEASTDLFLSHLASIEIWLFICFPALMNLGRLGKREILDMIDSTNPERLVEMLFLEFGHAIASTTGDHLDQKAQTSMTLSPRE